MTAHRIPTVSALLYHGSLAHANQTRLFIGIGFGNAVLPDECRKIIGALRLPLAQRESELKDGKLGIAFASEVGSYRAGGQLASRG